MSYIRPVVFTLILPALLLSVACNGAPEAPSLGPLPTVPGLTPFPTLPSGEPGPTTDPGPGAAPGLTPFPTLPSGSQPSPSVAPELPTATGLTPFPTLPIYGQPGDAAEAVVTVGESRFVVEVADTPDKRQQGLSDREPLEEGAGMLFIYDYESVYSFWMNRMHFPLDMIWIDSSCAVSDITRDAPPPEPGQSPEDLPRFQPNAPAQYVLEVNAGVAAASGISPGDPVSFGGSLDGESGC